MHALSLWLRSVLWRFVAYDSRAGARARAHRLFWSLKQARTGVIAKEFRMADVTPQDIH
jgi:hypothetical protein